jgi:hypothetical protein
MYCTKRYIVALSLPDSRPYLLGCLAVLLISFMLQVDTVLVLGRLLAPTIVSGSWVHKLP